QFLDIARSWYALAEMVDKGKVVKIVVVTGATETGDRI
ncbi:MAG: hypothetical protein QOG74_1967, partial [Alphaproteobacteria bacterium]|nr:hypothetical protein [Alphaproteobacteria bacterium]